MQITIERNCLVFETVGFDRFCLNTHSLNYSFHFVPSSFFIWPVNFGVMYIFHWLKRSAVVDQNSMRTLLLSTSIFLLCSPFLCSFNWRIDPTNRYGKTFYSGWEKCSAIEYHWTLKHWTLKHWKCEWEMAIYAILLLKPSYRWR